MAIPGRPVLHLDWAAAGRPTRTTLDAMHEMREPLLRISPHLDLGDDDLDRLRSALNDT